MSFTWDLCLLQENFFDIQEALQAIHMRQEMLREQLACAKSKGEETVGRNLQVGRFPPDSCNKILKKTAFVFQLHGRIFG